MAYSLMLKSRGINHILDRMPERATTDIMQKCRKYDAPLSLGGE